MLITMTRRSYPVKNKAKLTLNFSTPYIDIFLFITQYFNYEQLDFKTAFNIIFKFMVYLFFLKLNVGTTCSPKPVLNSRKKNNLNIFKLKSIDFCFILDELMVQVVQQVQNKKCALKIQESVTFDHLSSNPSEFVQMCTENTHTHTKLLSRYVWCKGRGHTHRHTGTEPYLEPGGVLQYYYSWSHQIHPLNSL